MVEGKMNVVKYLMFFFNFIFWLSGLGLIIVGALVRDKYGDYFSFIDSKFASVSVLIIVVGAVVFVIGFLGCCGAIKENYCMVTSFAVLISIVFLLEIVAGALGFVYKKNIEKYASGALERGSNQYGTVKGATHIMKFVQKEFKCCGAAGASSYAKNVTDGCNGDGNVNGVPSCHEGGKCSGTLYDKPCLQGFIDWCKSKLVLIGGVAIGFAVIQLMGIVFSCCLMREIKGEYEVV